MRSLLLLLATPALLAAQTVLPARDSIRLVVGQVDTSRAVLRGATGALAYTGTASTIFTAHRDGRLTALAVGCGYQRISFGDWTRAQVRVCVEARPMVPLPDTPSAVSVLFRADFPTLGAPTGWPIVGGAGLEVIPADTLDFPTPNVLRVTAIAARQGYAFLRTDRLPPLSVGESRYYRWYTRLVVPDGQTDLETHPHQDGNANGDANWLFHIWSEKAGPGQWVPEFRAKSAWPNDRWDGPALRKHETYRFEFRVQRTGANTMRLEPRVYDAQDRLIADGLTFRNVRGVALSQQDVALPLPDNLRGFNAGLNGLGGLARDVVYAYQGGFSVCAVTWCGAWRAGLSPPMDGFIDTPNVRPALWVQIFCWTMILGLYCVMFVGWVRTMHRVWENA